MSLTIFASCATVKQYNSRLEKPKNAQKLQSDVDYIYRKLQNLHPNLYWYISEDDLKFKFDSLKASINRDMTSEEFYFLISPVIASIKQGHTRILPPTKRVPFKEQIHLDKTGSTPLQQLDFEIFNDKLYFAKKIPGKEFIVPGTEILRLNDNKPQEIISKYRSTFASDGYNKTYLSRRLSTGFPSFYYYEYGIEDSIKCEYSIQDSVSSIYLTKATTEDSKIKLKSKEKTASEKKLEKQEKKKRRVQGHSDIDDTYSKNLSFIDPDSSTALLKVKDFVNGNHSAFYAKSFELLNSAGTKNLLLDLRDNPGGNIRDALDLYTYLADTSFTFIDTSEVASQNSLFHSNFLKIFPWPLNVIMAITYPGQLFTMALMTSLVEEKDEKYYLPLPESLSRKPDKDRYKGDLYVLINGGSFSASCILSSNLKSRENTVFIGEETGGSAKGTVAGIMACKTLPASKLNVWFGLILIEPSNKPGIDGRGIFPDIEVIPSLDDLKNGRDPVIERILGEIGK